MFQGTKMKKFVVILAIVMVASFALAAIIFVGEYGRNGFAGLENNLRPADAIDVNEEKTEAISGIKNIKVSTSSDDITFIATDGKEVKAHYHGYYKSNDKNFKPEFTVTSIGDELTIKVSKSVGMLTIGNLSYSTDLKLDIYLPRSYSDNLQINVTSAKINIDELNLNNFICKTSSGDVAAGMINAKKAELGTASGSTKISGSYDSFVFNSTSGDFSTNGITAANANFSTASGEVRGNVSSDVLQLHSTSGDLTLDPVNAKKCTVDTASGHTTLRGVPGEIYATSSSGDIDLEYKEYNHNITIKTASGKTEIKLPENPEFALSFKTSAGSGKCAFPLTITGAQKRNNIEGTVTSNRNSISVSSSSGDLTIKR